MTTFDAGENADREMQDDMGGEGLWTAEIEVS